VQTYKGTYTDDSGTIDIVVANDFSTLSCEIDGIQFSGGQFSDFETNNKYTAEELGRFTFCEIPIYNSDRSIKILCNCAFTIIIPQLIIDKSSNTTFDVVLKLEYSLGKPRGLPGEGIEHEYIKASFIIAGQNFEGTGDYVEDVFDKISKQFNDKYQFKNCYGCMFGDYSVYGQSGFGAMLCYVLQREEYLKVKTKKEFAILSGEVSQVQETFLCERYEPRKPGTGYRG